VLPLQSVRELQDFEKWIVDFLGPINPPARHSKDRYIISAIDYLMRWDKEEEVHDFSIDTATRFILENIIAWFGCPKSLTSDEGSHFINNTIYYPTP
jgi:hypothetical protein